MECGWKDLAIEAPIALKYLQAQLDDAINSAGFHRQSDPGRSDWDATSDWDSGQFQTHFLYFTQIQAFNNRVWHEN